jgi:pimeloyl-ACP methyl ester carboxylesterase
VAPIFGGTARSMFSFAHALNLNGFRTIRVDFRNHVGRSDGQIIDARLSTQVEDITLAAGSYPQAIVLGISLAARPAARAVATGAPICALVLLTPVVNLQTTLHEVTGRDYCGPDFEALTPTVKVLDYDIKEEFIHDALAHGLTDLPSTIADLNQPQPITLIAGDADPWVAITEVRQVRAEIGPTADLVEVPAAAHRLNRNPTVTMRYITETVLACLRRVGATDIDPQIPTFDDLLTATLNDHITDRHEVIGAP